MSPDALSLSRRKSNIFYSESSKCFKLVNNKVYGVLAKFKNVIEIVSSEMARYVLESDDRRMSQTDEFFSKPTVILLNLDVDKNWINI